MDAANGVGLAANQIGYLRLFVYDCTRTAQQTACRRGGHQSGAWRPEIPETTTLDTDDEGCLSVPGESFPPDARSGHESPDLDADAGPVGEVEGHRADAAARNRAP